MNGEHAAAKKKQPKKRNEKKKIQVQQVIMSYALLLCFKTRLDSRVHKELWLCNVRRARIRV